jgi:hypothetical protein
MTAWSEEQHRACARAAGVRLSSASGRLEWSDLYQAAALRVLESPKLPLGFAAQKGVQQLLRDTFKRRERLGVSSPVPYFPTTAIPIWTQAPIGLDEEAALARLAEAKEARAVVSAALAAARHARAQARWRRRMAGVRAARRAAKLAAQTA